MVAGTHRRMERMCGVYFRRYVQEDNVTITSAAVTARIESFSESSTKIAAGLGDAMALLEHLQSHTMVVTAADDPLTLDSFTPAAGSPEQRLLDAIALRKGVAAVVDRYGQFLRTLGSGDDDGQLEKQRHLLEAATEELRPLLGGDAAALGADQHLAADAGSAQRGTTPSANVAKLETAGVKARFILGVVAKVGGASTAGGIAGGLGMLSDGVTRHVRQEEGLKTLATLVPDLQPDVENLAHVLVESEAPLTSAADELASRLLAWTNAHRPAPGDPARAGYNLELSSLLADVGRIRALVQGVAASAAQLAPAHAEIGQMAASVPTTGEALKALAIRAESVARRRR
jgi:hypothetical protein